MYLAPVPAPVAASLGDLSNLKEIVGDVQSIAKTGDFVAAEKRITDFKSAWDEAASAMRPKNPAAWGNLDDAADAAIHALRAQAPDGARVRETVSALLAALDNPSGTAGAAGKSKVVSGIAVTDASGHAIACEEMINALRAAIAGGKIARPTWRRPAISSRRRPNAATQMTIRVRMSFRRKVLRLPATRSPEPRRHRS